MNCGLLLGSHNQKNTHRHKFNPPLWQLIYFNPMHIPVWNGAGHLGWPFFFVFQKAPAESRVRIDRLSARNTPKVEIP